MVQGMLRSEYYYNVRYVEPQGRGKEETDCKLSADVPCRGT